MQRTSSNVFGGLLVLLAVFSCVLITPTSALQVQYCSKQNTASGESLEHEWNSNGWCHDRCKEKNAAFAIVQFTSCFCSDWIPLVQIGGENCQAPCPGYPTEQCGDSEKQTFGYIAIAGKKPAGTLGASTTSVASSTTKTVSPSTESSIQTTLKTSTKSSPTDSEATPDPTQPVRTVTVSGTPVVTILPPASASALPPVIKKSSPSAGLIAGIVVGVVLGLALIIALILFLLWRRRQNGKSFIKDPADRSSALQRNTSTLSRTGLLKSSPGVLDTSVAGAAARSDKDTPTSNHRDSGFLRPGIMLMRSNTSRTSVGTVNDNEDYSRPLKIRNPDPE